MRQHCLAAVVAAVGIFALAATASAQVWPGHHHYQGHNYDGWGGYPSGLDALPSTLNIASARRVAEADRLMGDAVAARQLVTRQSNINTAMSADAQQRQGYFSQQESSRDWWFQAQQQSMAQQRAMAAHFAEAAPSTAHVPLAAVPAAKTDVIPWLSLLCEPQFAEQRERIEAPYRRSDKGLSQPMPDDYRNMIAAADQMKTILKGMTARVSAQDYLNAEAFLNQLASEARARLEKEPAKK